MSVTTKIPVFSENKLKELVHYTDQEDNPTYEAIKSNAFYKIYSGAKGVSKSFSRMIETVYRIVNQKNFCSVWCRNQFNHIKNTLKPMLEKVLFYLANEHNLDFRPYFKITAEAAYWTLEDGGEGRAIYFQNWEKIQAFQGFTLKNNNFRFGELVIDEPLEDNTETKKLPHELKELYEIQQEKLPLLIANTVLRENAPDNFNVNVTFLYNIFTTEHFLIQDYHMEALKILNADNSTNEEILNELLTKNYVQKENKDFAQGLGLIVTMFSKYFVPAKNFGEMQRKNLDILKKTNYRLWVITVVGFAFNVANDKEIYFMRPILFDANGQIRKDKIKTISRNKFHNYLKTGEVIQVFHGYDPGIHDNAALVSVALLKNGTIIVFEAIPDIKELINKKVNFINKAINEKVANIIEKSNAEIIKYLPYAYVQNNFMYGKESILFSDNQASIEALNILFEQKNINTKATKAVRKPSQLFGIVERQTWQKNIFENEMIELLPEAKILINCLAKQVILYDGTSGSEKRDETINKEIYDLINAFEMANSYSFRYQYILLNRKIKNSKELIKNE